MTKSELPQSLREAVKAEADARGFDEAATRWLALLLRHDATLPAPTAGAMVARVRDLPIGADLAALDAALRQLGARDPDGMTTSERRVTAMLLQDLAAQARALLASQDQPPLAVQRHHAPVGLPVRGARAGWANLLPDLRRGARSCVCGPDAISG